MSKGVTIVSVSLNEDIIGEIDKLQKELGFSGRSEIVRAGLRSLIAEEKERKNLAGNVHAVMLVIHDEKSDNEVNEMGHSFDSIITTHIHNKTGRDKCLEVFLLKGDAKEINEMVKRFKTNRKMDHVRLLPM
ncbi:putative nickel-responsive regulator 1 [Candidatus Nitrososphaera gargensis Ga9.2]|uniref:Putative nickel-responsive regulator 1 n=1 Tax=Nitrososphaera gargensis (strain Ga9.2) TaxID=1237085 RepID=K0IKC9_NITGG|nr:CopG family ribbon-helix-helix protein [Candidatus Nitrososphaera gargensis]AFU59683.1 putative nickel-responsive regulator 1 [Candidatus Nitrososphaera gargensis Ga9.2]